MFALHQVSSRCLCLIAELERDFLFVLHTLLGFDVALYLCLGVWSEGFGR